MHHFDSIEDIKTAEIKDLLEVPSMNQASAEAVYRFFHERAPETAEHKDDAG